MTGFIGVGQLRYILTNLGEKMSDDEVDELLKAVDTSSGEICYTGTFSHRPPLFVRPRSTTTKTTTTESVIVLF
jgi:hypothetical protein